MLKDRKLEYPIVTIMLTGCNIFIFLVCIVTGNLLYQLGSLEKVRVIEYGEYYRLLTCMFLHADYKHLFNNMILFYFMGEIIEPYLGHLRFLIIYVFSGIGGGCLSLVYGFIRQIDTVSIGASGAIFGMVGALLYLVIRHKGNLKQITIRKIMFFLILSCYSGFIGTNIDNAAHIGGFLTGFFTSILLNLCIKINETKRGKF